MKLTIKEVLDKFAEEPLRWRSNQACHRYRAFVRTHINHCPLQVVTQRKWEYGYRAVELGLELDAVVAIMRWADGGKWQYGTHKGDGGGQ